MGGSILGLMVLAIQGTEGLQGVGYLCKAECVHPRDLDSVPVWTVVARVLPHSSWVSLVRLRGRGSRVTVSRLGNDTGRTRE